jgi:hypothetical protein
MRLRPPRLAKVRGTWIVGPPHFGIDERPWLVAEVTRLLSDHRADLKGAEPAQWDGE